MAKDLGLKSKDLSDILATHGFEVKTTQRTLEPVEFDILLETLTRENQISNIEDYLDGVTKIPSKIIHKEVPKEEKAPEVKVEEPKAEPAPAPKAEQPKAEQKPEGQENAKKRRRRYYHRKPQGK